MNTEIDSNNLYKCTMYSMLLLIGGGLFYIIYTQHLV